MVAFSMVFTYSAGGSQPMASPSLAARGVWVSAPWATVSAGGPLGGALVAGAGRFPRDDDRRARRTLWVAFGPCRRPAAAGYLPGRPSWWTDQPAARHGSGSRVVRQSTSSGVVGWPTRSCGLAWRYSGHSVAS